MSALAKKRLKALLVDIIILGVLGILILIIFMIVVDKNFLCIYSLTIAIVYSLFFCKDVINGQSIGKKMLKLQIITEKGKAASLRSLIIRNMIALMQPIDALYMINNPGKRLGDIVCKTRVVDASRKIKYEFNPLLLIFHIITVVFVTFSFFIVICIMFLQ